MSKLSIDHLWRVYEFEPNENQRRAILHRDGPLFLTAGPGSGKTRVLLWRTVNLIVFHDIPPNGIFLSTFTEKAALQLKEGLREMLGYTSTVLNQPFDISNMYVGTVHSLCQRLISDRRFSEQRRRTRPPLLMDEIGQYLFLHKRKNWANLARALGMDEEGAMEKINGFFSGNSSRSKHRAVENCIAFFNRLSEECVDPQQIIARVKDEELKVFLKLYDHYLNSLNGDGKNSLTDFALLQQKALERLINHKSGDSVFSHVIIDEYQDTNTIQERLFFKLAETHHNLCVVGDDDQALYRFRGATVENFVQFAERCEKEWRIKPRTIPLVRNYRSRSRIVDFYNEFIHNWDWSEKGDGHRAHFRVSKKIDPHRTDRGTSVVVTKEDKQPRVAAEIAQLVRRLLDKKIVSDPNQIAFLFPSLKVKMVEYMKAELEKLYLKVYAPRAGRFLETNEALDFFGVLANIVGKPARGDFPGADYNEFHNWIDNVTAHGSALIEQDENLKRFVKNRRDEIETAVSDYQALLKVAEQNRWKLDAPYNIDRMKRPLTTAGVSERARQSLASTRQERVIKARQATANPFSLKYIILSATSLDTSLLDLFYRICGLEPFKHAFDLAECGEDEGPIANLSLISQYIERFMDEYTPILTADFLAEHRLSEIFYGSYLYALFRRGESEFENAEDPFPKGRVPFITIHQAKGLEFPVVVLPQPQRRKHEPNKVEFITRQLTSRSGEPLDRIDGFDTMRMFYVALSRAQNLLVIARPRGPGISIQEPFKTMLTNGLPTIGDLDLRDVPRAGAPKGDVPKSYSFTSDYQFYNKCARQYMVFRKYSFVESRAQTMFFGSLVHQTIEDLHQFLIDQRKKNETRR